MTIIYVITEGNYSDYHIEAVCSSLEKCQEWAMYEVRRKMIHQRRYIKELEEELAKPVYKREYDWDKDDHDLHRRISHARKEIEKMNYILKTGNWKPTSDGSHVFFGYRVEEYILDRFGDEKYA
jgi:hypothetical protein